MVKMRGTDDGGIFGPTEGRSGTVGQKKRGKIPTESVSVCEYRLKR